MEPITSTAQFLNVVSTADPKQLVHLLVFVVLGFMLAPAAQATIEHNLAEKPWMPKGLKPWLPTLVSSALGLLATHFGVDTAAATALVASLSAATHTVNASEMAAVAEPPKAGA